MKRTVVLLAAGTACALLSAPASGADPFPAPAPASDAAPVVVQAGKTTAGIDVELPERSLSPATVTGRLVDAKTKAPVRNYEVHIFTGTGRGVTEFSSDNGSFKATVPASSKGYFVCFTAERDENDAAPYAARCLPHATWDGDLRPAGASRLPLAKGEHNALGQIGLQRGAEIRGRVFNSAHVRLRTVNVIVRSLSDPSFTEYFGTGQHSGIFIADGLPASAKGWQVCFRGYDASPLKGAVSPRYYADKCYRDVRWHGGPLPKGATPVKVAPGKIVSGVDAVLHTAATISGVVTAARGGAPISRANVTVFTSSGHAFVTSARTDVHGRYTVVGLPGKRRYRVCVDPSGQIRPPGQSYFGVCHGGARWHSFAPVPNGAVSVGASEGHTTRVNVALPQAAEIDGTIKSATGQPLINAGVSVFTSSGKPAVYSGQLGGAQAHFHIVGLAARKGGYIICAHDTSYYTQSTNQTSYHAPQCLGGAAWNGSDNTVPRNATTVHVRAGQRKGGIAIALPAGGAITGRVRDSQTGEALDEQFAYLYDADGNYVSSADARSSDDGYYRFDGLEPSAAGYLVCFSGTFASDNTSTHEYRGRCYQEANWNH